MHYDVEGLIQCPFCYWLIVEYVCHQFYCSNANSNTTKDTEATERWLFCLECSSVMSPEGNSKEYVMHQGKGPSPKSLVHIVISAVSKSPTPKKASSASARTTKTKAKSKPEPVKEPEPEEEEGEGTLLSKAFMITHVSSGFVVVVVVF